MQAVVLLAIALVIPADAAPKWTRLQSENFLFIGDAPEGQIRRVAQRLEQFRDVLLSVLPGTNNQSNVPTIVMVFDDTESMTPVKPMFRGNTVELAGYFQGGEEANYIAIDAEDLDVAVPSIFHEYAHALIRDRQGEVPVWVGEGLAELYSTTEYPDAKSALIGRAPGPHVMLLQSSTLIPIKDLLAIDHNSNVYNEGMRRGVLYAQSWAFVHYLTLGSKERAPEFRKYLAALQAGTPHEQAFAASFANAALLDGELFNYVRRFSFPAVRVSFSEKTAATSVPRGMALDDDEADAYVADIQARVNRVDDARARVAAIQKRNPNVGRALMVLGAIDLREKRVDSAVTQLEKAATLSPDDFIVQITYARALISQMSEVRNDAVRASKILPAARQALARATTINPNSSQAAYLLGYAELAGRGDIAAAVASLDRATKLAPRRDEYRITLAQALVRQGEYEKATTLLGPLIGAGRTSEIREEARRILGQVADIRNASATPPAAPAPSPVETPPAETRREGTRAALMLRTVQPGEQRVLATLDAIDCATSGVVIRVSSEGRKLALKAKQFTDVDFVSYRSTPPGQVICGPQKTRDRVYATYRPDATAPGIDGVAVAIEMLPDDFVAPKPQQ